MADKISEIVDEVQKLISQGTCKIDMKSRCDIDSYFSTPDESKYCQLNDIPFDDSKAFSLYLTENLKDTLPSGSLIDDIVVVALSQKSTEAQLGEVSPYIYTLF
jgi:hypothetical protein